VQTYNKCFKENNYFCENFSKKFASNILTPIL
jgi:hypothetical protein